MKTPFKTSVEFARHLRKEQTKAEAIFWKRVRNRRFLELKFRRQVPIDKYTVDFLCESEKLIIEIDDPSHEDKKEYDRKRTEVLEHQGYRVMRFWNEEIYNNLEDVLRHITACVGDS